MVIEPNTRNQVKFEDPEGDILMVDVVAEDVIFTFKRGSADYRAVLLDSDDIAALAKHLDLVPMGEHCPGCGEVYHDCICNDNDEED